MHRMADCKITLKNIKSDNILKFKLHFIANQYCVHLALKQQESQSMHLSSFDIEGVFNNAGYIV